MVERVLRVDEVERCVVEGEVFAVCDLERQSRRRGVPLVEAFDVDRDDLSDALAEQAGDAAVAAADVEQRLVPAERKAELVEAPQLVPMHACVHQPHARRRRHGRSAVASGPTCSSCT
jgi:hypothetical protein